MIAYILAELPYKLYAKTKMPKMPNMVRAEYSVEYSARRHSGKRNDTDLWSWEDGREGRIRHLARQSEVLWLITCNLATLRYLIYDMKLLAPLIV